MTENKWVIHYITEDPICAHTHGLEKYLGNEVEISIPVNHQTAMMLLNTVGNEVVYGDYKLKLNHRNFELFNMPVYFFELPSTLDKTKNILRLVIPDPNNKFPWDNDCDYYYQQQLSNEEIIWFKGLN